MPYETSIDVATRTYQTQRDAEDAVALHNARIARARTTWGASPLATEPPLALSGNTIMRMHLRCCAICHRGFPVLYAASSNTHRLTSRTGGPVGPVELCVAHWSATHRDNEYDTDGLEVGHERHEERDCDLHV